ncbi:F-box/FBD/LRR-repeat protein At1g13570-like [Apium graveolens]|uniref:F-box/FBD/LRR-repeat protein At1g13570-like n=1 Tax=Apium graveolens TaxID=4045 RepID=UPI003D7A86E4
MVHTEPAELLLEYIASKHIADFFGRLQMITMVSPILKFSLEILNGHFDTRTISDHIAQWIPLFSRKGVKQLALEIFYFGEIIGTDFSSLDLTYLKLTRVILPSTLVFGEFTYLTNLELFQATYLGKSLLNCPVLEKLMLKHCIGLSPTTFNAPELKCLHEISDQIRLQNITEFSFGLCSYSFTKRKASNLVEVLGSLNKIEKFSIGIFFIRYLAEGDCPERLSEPMPYLKTLNIFQVNFSDLSEVSCLLCLIRSAPNLRKLHISAVHSKSSRAERNVINYLVENSEAGPIDRLESVNFSFVEGRRVELELVKFILAHSLLLKTMVPYGFVDKTIGDHIAQWIPLFSRKGVKQLALEKVIGHDFSSLDLTYLKLETVMLTSTLVFGEFT